MYAMIKLQNDPNKFKVHVELIMFNASHFPNQMMIMIQDIFGFRS